ncbi:MAG: hypothetical protein KDA60_02720 [Planctomycetales bacterium]|nr:hypothetical protein [Planctomycetales bacterium]
MNVITRASRILACHLLLCPAGFAAEFIPLGILQDGPIVSTVPGSRAWSISDDGLVISGTTPHPDVLGHVPFRWTRETGMVPLDTDWYVVPPIMSADGSLIAFGAKLWTEKDGLLEFGDLEVEFTHGTDDNVISSDGTVLATGVTSSNNGPNRWTQTGGLESIFGIPIPSTITQVGLSPDGSTIVGTVGTHDQRSVPWTLFRWTEAEGESSLGESPGQNIYEISGISGNGSVIMGHSRPISNNAAGREGTTLWRWTEESGLVALEEATPGWHFERNSNRRGISTDGSVLVGALRSNDGESVSAFRWTETHGIELLPGISGYSHSAVKDLTPDGKWLFGQSWTTPFNPGEVVPWLWSEDTGSLNLLDIFEQQGLGPEMEDWTSLWDVGSGYGQISADGQAVIGSGMNPEGRLEAWVVYLDPIAVPEPSTAILLTTLLLPVFASRRTLRREVNILRD